MRDKSIQFIQQLIGYIEKYKVDVSNTLNGKIAYGLFKGVELPKNMHKKCEIKSQMRFHGLVAHNAIKINLNAGDRLVVFYDGSNPKILVLSADTYHDKRIF
jgi:hypothetical protein